MLPETPQADVKRSGTAMALLGLLEAQHQRAQFGQPQPMRHHAAQDTALLAEKGRSRSALSRDDETDARAARLLRLKRTTLVEKLKRLERPAR